MDIFGILKNDHREVMGLFEVLLKKDEIDPDKLGTLCTLLSIHMELEEKLVYDRLKECRETLEIIAESFAEHSEARTLVRSLERGKLDDVEMKVKTEMLKLAIQHHVQEEEGEMFPKAKKVLSDDEAKELGEEFTRQKQKRLEKVK